MSVPQVVSETEWAQALQEVRADEKRATRASDALAARRRRLPAVAVDKPYRFAGPDGDAGLLDLFDGRPQLILYHCLVGAAGADRTLPAANGLDAALVLIGEQRLQP